VIGTKGPSLARASAYRKDTRACVRHILIASPFANKQRIKGATPKSRTLELK
jgi:hypothetical protein